MRDNAALGLVAGGTILLVAAAAPVTLWRGRFGALLSGIGLFLFLTVIWGTLGAHGSGSNLTVAVVGPGVEWTAAGLVAGALAYRFPARSLSDLLTRIRTPSGLVYVGLFLAATFLAIDAVDHAQGGDAFAIFGTGPLENALHAGFVLPIAILAGLFLVRRSVFSGRSGTTLIGLALVSMILDGVFHFVAGDVNEFVGHTAPEMIAHVATYYGIALLVASRLLAAKSGGTRRELGHDFRDA